MRASVSGPIVKIDGGERFQIVIVSGDARAKDVLFPVEHKILSLFKNIHTISNLSSNSNISSLLNLYLSGKRDKFVVLVQEPSSDLLVELKRLVYGAQTAARGLLFAFSLGSFSDVEFEHLIRSGFDDVFEFDGSGHRCLLRLYSWMRRFGEETVPSENADQDVIRRIANRKDFRIGRWTIVAHERKAHDELGATVQLTKQEVDFLAHLSNRPEDAASYRRLFKAPHAIFHKLKKKLGDDLPIRHDVEGRYILVGV